MNHPNDAKAPKEKEELRELPALDFGPPYITLAHTFNAPHGWAIRNRTLRQYALQYVVDGTAEYPVSGQSYTTVKGDLLFHRPGELHSILTIDREPYVCLSLVFHFGETAYPVDELFGDRHLVGNYLGHPVERMLSQLVAMYGQPGAASYVQCQGLLLQILAEASAHAKRSDSPDEPSPSPAVRKEKGAHRAKLVLIKNYILDHYQEDVLHEQLEDIAGYSRNYIIAKFREAFGLSPMQYLTWVRVQKAKELAIQTDLSISEIAALVGYSDVHTFGKMFKKKTGTSLTQFCSSLVTTKH